MWPRDPLCVPLNFGSVTLCVSLNFLEVTLGVSAKGVLEGVLGGVTGKKKRSEHVTFLVKKMITH